MISSKCEHPEAIHSGFTLLSFGSSHFPFPVSTYPPKKTDSTRSSTSVEPPSDGSAAAEKLNLLLAGGDQIDAWWGSWTDYASDGIILPLTDYVKAPEGQALYELWEPWGAWEGVTDTDGTIWAIPRMTDTTPYQVFVRNDWLELAFQIGRASCRERVSVRV